MTDVTTAGSGGDAHEMAATAKARIVIEDRNLRTLVDPVVLSMLDRLQIDYLGVSLDALLVVAPAKARIASSGGGGCGCPHGSHRPGGEGNPAAVLVVDGREQDFTPGSGNLPTPRSKRWWTGQEDFDEMKAGWTGRPWRRGEEEAVLARITGPVADETRFSPVARIL